MGSLCLDTVGCYADSGLRGRSEVRTSGRVTRREAQDAELIDRLDRLREFHNRSMLAPTDMGSFDCVSLRFAEGNFAQDDRLRGIANILPQDDRLL